MPQTRLIDVCDREADFFEPFDEQRQNPWVELLVRAKHDRNFDEKPFKLFAAARGAPVQSRILVSAPRQSADRLRRAIAINLVVVWRIMLMTLLGRETPELSAQLMFSDIELRPLHAYAKKET